MTDQITIIGLGAGDLDQLTIGSYKVIKAAKHLYLRTEEHPSAKALLADGIIFQTFDEVYESHKDFEGVYKEITQHLITETRRYHEIVYAVPGHPLVAEQTIQILLEKAEQEGIMIEIKGGQSFLDPLFSSLKIDPIEGFQMVDATHFLSDELSFGEHLIICQVYDGFVASEVKLGLLEHLPPDYRVAIVVAAGSSEEQIRFVPLHELDYDMDVNNLRSVYVPPVKNQELLFHQFTTLRTIIRTLRGPNGCPWDKKQTHQSLKKYLIEEAYEVLAAIDEEDDEHLVEELGDVLLQVMLHAQIGEDEGYFSVEDVIASLSEKMVRRHPHVFSNGVAENEKDVEKIWQEVKAMEKQEAKLESLLNLQPGMNVLHRASELQKQAAKVGFDWDSIEPVWTKILEEVEECRESVEYGDPNQVTGELGDLFFAVVNLSRKLKIDPVVALEMTNQKFIRRFQFIEQEAIRQNRPMEEMNLEEMDKLWELSKEKEAEIED